MAKFNTKEEYQKWVDGEEWYQTMELPSGVKIEGKVPTHLREPLFDGIDFNDKTFLDIGCNAGQYCFTALDRGAKQAHGIDLLEDKIEHAKILAENEEYENATFEVRNIFDLEDLPPADILFCIAVVTEIQDTFSALEVLKQKIGSYGLVELNLAKPVAYLSSSKEWIKGYDNIPRRTAVTQVRQIRGGKWITDVSFDVLKAFFGSEFTLSRKKGGVRYDLIEIVRNKK